LPYPSGASAAKGWSVRPFKTVHDLSSNRREAGWLISAIILKPKNEFR